MNPKLKLTIDKANKIKADLDEKKASLRKAEEDKKLKEERRLDKIAQKWLDENLFKKIEKTIINDQICIELDERKAILASKIDGLYYEKDDVIFDKDFPRVTLHFISWNKK